MMASSSAQLLCRSTRARKNTTDPIRVERTRTKFADNSSRITILILFTSHCLSVHVSCEHNRTNRLEPNEYYYDDDPPLPSRLSIASLFNFQSDPITRCGHSLSRYNERIVGGTRATITDYPWMVSLQREKGFWFGFKGFYHSCGGSLITPSWIITAAHCLYNRDEPLRVVAGTDNLNYLYRAQLRSIDKAIMHPDFDPETYNNDIALLKVSQPFNFDSTFSRIGAICLDRDVPVYPYDIATICGFGARAFHNKARAHLYETDIAIIDRQICNSSFQNLITQNMICAGGMIANKRDACSGDSGGPLQMDVDGHMTLIGLVSFGNDCAVKGFPGIYTRVENYFDWLKGILDESLLEP